MRTVADRGDTRDHHGDFLAVPAELRERRQWVVWRTETRAGKATKVPYRADAPRQRADTSKPATWGTFDQARLVQDVDGIGFVFSADDPYTGVDLDRCFDPATGEIHAEASEIIATLGGYVERSPSGRGFHVIVIAEHRGERCRTEKTPWGGDIEVYNHGRYFTMTGHGKGAIATRQQQLDTIVAKYLPPAPKPPARVNGHTNGHAAAIGDHELLERMFASKKNGAAIRELYRGGGPEDVSAGDQALCNHLGFWFGPDFDDIERAFRASGRYREKWEREDYRRLTIDKALAGKTSFYRDRGSSSNAAPAPGDDGEAAESTTAAERISKRWGIVADPIESWRSIGNVRDGGRAILYLTRTSGKVMRFPRLADLCDAAKQTKIVSEVARSRFHPLTKAEATDIYQLLIEMCAEEDSDPLDEARSWMGDFIDSASATVDGDGLTDWDMLDELKRTEKERDMGDRAEHRPVLIRKDGKLWLPVGALKDSIRDELTQQDLDNRLIEIGWRKINVDVREPATRAERADGSKRGRHHRNFYVGEA